jgi:hypothetical protein
MLLNEDIRIDEFFANGSMPFGMTLVHMPSGIQVTGNCKSELSKENLRATLMNALAQFVQAEAVRSPAVKAAPVAVDGENAYLREQMNLLKAQIDRLIGTREKAVPVPRAGKRARKTGRMSPEKRAAVGQRLKAAREAKRARVEPEPAPPAEPSLEALLRQQMRPPTDAPSRGSRLASPSKGSSVAVSNVDWIKE